tara:strand:- start:1371 stop:1694 length:324 start_codon:yes stop_codon:yes gene_type:complete
MLKKKQRLTKKEFDHVFKNGKRVHSPILQLIYQPGEQFHGAAVVGKKVYKKAVDRNRLRRRLYAVLYRQQKEVERAGTYILIAKPAIKEVSKQQFTNEVAGVLQKTQ